MLVGHLAPAYFAVVASRPHWKPEWTKEQRAALWIVAFGSTVAPDWDVIYNTLFRGFCGHTVLWTHSIFPYCGLVLVWWLLRRPGRWPYLQMMVGLMAIGGLSHLVLDVVAHSTPLLYPFSLHMFGIPSPHVVSPGLWYYFTDPVLLAEAVLIAGAIVHWMAGHRVTLLRVRKMALVGLFSGLVVLSVLFLWVLPKIQFMVATRNAG